ncbi:META domain-containing protein [Nocardioides coralli]|uniref:META domain-containing protein n=1 Tax=Nocardioides coralli TaxID=2872154 RepID=UPI001CA3A170|nr:META domain-containing protein [Nocardioides coralli]QZY29989.1 META domain-containing protein [Nocardioides coralli]
MKPLLLLLLLPLVACGSETGRTAGEPPWPGELPSGEFVVASLPAPFQSGDRARVDFREGEVSFSATCNTMTGTARVVDGVLEVDGVGGTEMGCPGAGHDQDAWLVDFFTGRPQLSATDDTWSLTGPDAELQLLRPDTVPDMAPAAPLEGTRWRLTGIERVDGDAVSLRGVGSVEADLTIEEGGIRFRTGCNGGGGDVTVEDDQLVLSEVVTTLRACPGERGEVEAGVMAVLGAERVDWVITGQELRLGAGDVALLYEAG